MLKLVSEDTQAPTKSLLAVTSHWESQTATRNQTTRNAHVPSFDRQKQDQIIVGAR